MSWWNLAFIPIVMIIAFGKGRSVIAWSIFTLFAGFWAVIIVGVISAKEIRFPQWIKQLILHRFIKKEMKEINSPADL